jgi:hypothetical protein
MDNTTTGVLRTELQAFRIQVRARLGQVFGLASLPDRRVLVKEVRGELRIIEHDRLLPGPVKGTPRSHPIDLFKP